MFKTNKSKHQCLVIQCTWQGLPRFWSNTPTIVRPRVIHFADNDNVAGFEPGPPANCADALPIEPPRQLILKSTTQKHLN